MAAHPRRLSDATESSSEQNVDIQPGIKEGWSFSGWIWRLWAWLVGLWIRCKPFFTLSAMYLTMAFTTYSKQEKILKIWLKKELPSYPVEDLSIDLADGVILCGLMEALVPGTCPRHDLLPHEQPTANLRLASRLAFSYLGVTEDLVEAEGEYDTRMAMIKFLKAVRYAALRRQFLGGLPVTSDTVAQTLGDHQVLGRGMGLQMAVVGRKTRFALYFHDLSGLDLVVEIKSDKQDYCSHHITNRSRSRSRSMSNQNLQERHNIPLEYEVAKSEVKVSWIPLQQCRHTLAIIWRGQHILGSPYLVAVDESQNNSPGPRRQFLRPLLDGDNPEGSKSKMASANRLPSMKAQAGALRFMNILRRRVVRRVVHVGAEDVVLKGNESIGISPKARQAFQRMRSSSHESTEDESYEPPKATSRRKVYKTRDSSKQSIGGIKGLLQPHANRTGEKDDDEHRPNVSSDSDSVMPKNEGQVKKDDQGNSELGNQSQENVQLRNKDQENLQAGKHNRENQVMDPPFAHSAVSVSADGEKHQEIANDIESTKEINLQTEIPIDQTKTPALLPGVGSTIIENKSDSRSDEQQSLITEETTGQGHEVNTTDHASEDKTGKRKKKHKISKGITANSCLHFDQRCSNIINMCDYIIEHSPKKDALKTLEVANHIMHYTFNDVSESSYSVPATNSLLNEGYVDSSDAEENLVLESVIDEQGNVSVSLSSGDYEEADDENTFHSNSFDSEGGETSPPISDIEMSEIPPFSRKSFVIPEVTIEDVKSESSTTLESDTIESEITIDNAEINEGMTYLQTIDEETEPSSMVDDDRWTADLEACEELPEICFDEIKENVIDSKQTYHTEIKPSVVSEDIDETEKDAFVDASFHGETKGVLEHEIQFSEAERSVNVTSDKVKRVLASAATSATVIEPVSKIYQVDDTEIKNFSSRTEDIPEKESINKPLENKACEEPLINESNYLDSRELEQIQDVCVTAEQKNLAILSSIATDNTENTSHHSLAVEETNTLASVNTNSLVADETNILNVNEINSLVVGEANSIDDETIKDTDNSECEIIKSHEREDGADDILVATEDNCGQFEKSSDDLINCKTVSVSTTEPNKVEICKESSIRLPDKASEFIITEALVESGSAIASLNLESVSENQNFQEDLGNGLPKLSESVSKLSSSASKTYKGVFEITKERVKDDVDAQEIRKPLVISPNEQNTKTYAKPPVKTEIRNPLVPYSLQQTSLQSLQRAKTFDSSFERTEIEKSGMQNETFDYHRNYTDIRSKENVYELEQPSIDLVNRNSKNEAVFTRSNTAKDYAYPVPDTHSNINTPLLSEVAKITMLLEEKNCDASSTNYKRTPRVLTGKKTVDITLKCDEKHLVDEFPPKAEHTLKTFKSVSTYKSLFESKSIPDISGLQRNVVSLDEKSEKRTSSLVSDDQFTSAKKTSRVSAMISDTQKEDICNLPSQEISLHDTTSCKTVNSELQEKETKASINKSIPAPVISPDMSLLNQYRLEQGSTNIQNTKSIPSDDNNTAGSSLLQSIRNQSPPGPQPNSLPYSSFVKPSAEQDKRVSQLCSLFESSSTKSTRSFFPKSKRYIMQGDAMSNAASFDTASYISSKFSSDSNAQTDGEKARSKSFDFVEAISETTHTLSNLIDESSITSLVQDTKDIPSSMENVLVEPCETKVKVITLIKDELEDDSSKCHADEIIHEQNVEPLVQEEFGLRTKGKRLVNTLENMEKDIKEMQLCVQRLNEHYPVTSDSETSSPIPDHLHMTAENEQISRNKDMELNKHLPNAERQIQCCEDKIENLLNISKSVIPDKSLKGDEKMDVTSINIRDKEQAREILKKEIDFHSICQNPKTVSDDENDDDSLITIKVNENVAETIIEESVSIHSCIIANDLVEFAVQDSSLILGTQQNESEKNINEDNVNLLQQNLSSLKETFPETNTEVDSIDDADLLGECVTKHTKEIGNINPMALTDEHNAKTAFLATDNLRQNKSDLVCERPLIPDVMQSTTTSIEFSSETFASSDILNLKQPLIGDTSNPISAAHDEQFSEIKIALNEALVGSDDNNYISPKSDEENIICLHLPLNENGSNVDTVGNIADAFEGDISNLIGISNDTPVKEIPFTPALQTAQYQQELSAYNAEMDNSTIIGQEDSHLGECHVTKEKDRFQINSDTSQVQDKRPANMNINVLSTANNNEEFQECESSVNSSFVSCDNVLVSTSANISNVTSSSCVLSEIDDTMLPHSMNNYQGVLQEKTINPDHFNNTMSFKNSDITDASKSGAMEPLVDAFLIAEITNENQVCKISAVSRVTEDHESLILPSQDSLELAKYQPEDIESSEPRQSDIADLVHLIEQETDNTDIASVPQQLVNFEMNSESEVTVTLSLNEQGVKLPSSNENNKAQLNELEKNEITHVNLQTSDPIVALESKGKIGEDDYSTVMDDQVKYILRQEIKHKHSTLVTSTNDFNQDDYADEAEHRLPSPEKESKFPEICQRQLSQDQETNQFCFGDSDLSLSSSINNSAFFSIQDYDADYMSTAPTSLQPDLELDEDVDIPMHSSENSGAQSLQTAGELFVKFADFLRSRSPSPMGSRVASPFGSRAASPFGSRAASPFESRIVSPIGSRTASPFKTYSSEELPSLTSLEKELQELPPPTSLDQEYKKLPSLDPIEQESQELPSPANVDEEYQELPTLNLLEEQSLEFPPPIALQEESQKLPPPSPLEEEFQELPLPVSPEEESQKLPLSAPLEEKYEELFPPPSLEEEPYELPPPVSIENESQEIPPPAVLEEECQEMPPSASLEEESQELLPPASLEEKYQELPTQASHDEKSQVLPLLISLAKESQDMPSPASLEEKTQEWSPPVSLDIKYLPVNEERSQEKDDFALKSGNISSHDNKDTNSSHIVTNYMEINNTVSPLTISLKLDVCTETVEDVLITENFEGSSTEQDNDCKQRDVGTESEDHTNNKLPVVEAEYASTSDEDCGFSCDDIGNFHFIPQSFIDEQLRLKSLFDTSDQTITQIERKEQSVQKPLISLEGVSVVDDDGDSKAKNQHQDLIASAVGKMQQMNNETIDPISSCDSDSDDDMCLGPIKGCRPLIIPHCVSPCKSPITDSDSQSESDVTTDEDDIELPGPKSRRKYCKPARSHTSKLHTIPELSEDEEDEMAPVRPPRPRRSSLKNRKYSDGMGPDSPRFGLPLHRTSQLSPKTGRTRPDFPGQFENSEYISSPGILEEGTDDVFGAGYNAQLPVTKHSSPPSSSPSPSPYDEEEEDECDNGKITYGRVYMKGTFVRPLLLEGQLAQQNNTEKVASPNLHKNKEKDDETFKHDHSDNSPSFQSSIEPSNMTINDSSESKLNNELLRGNPSNISTTSSLEFVDDDNNHNSFFPPLETLLIPAHAIPVSVHSFVQPDNEQEKIDLDSTKEEPTSPDDEEKTYKQPPFVITPLGEKSILTPHAFVPPMEMLLLPTVPESLQCQEDQLQDSADKNVCAAESIVNTQEDSHDVARTVDIHEFGNLEGPLDPSALLHECNNVYIAEESLQNQEGDPQIVEEEKSTVDLIDVEHKESHSLDAIAQTIRNVPILDVSELPLEIEDHDRDITQDHNVTSDELCQFENEDKEGRVFQITETEEFIPKECRSNQGNSKSELENIQASEGSIHDEVALSQEHLSFFQSGGLQRLTMSLSVKNPAEPEIEKGEIYHDALYDASSPLIALDISKQKSSVDPNPFNTCAPDLYLDEPSQVQTDLEILKAQRNTTQKSDRLVLKEDKAVLLNLVTSRKHELPQIIPFEPQDDNDFFPAVSDTFSVTASSDPFSPLSNTDMKKQAVIDEQDYINNIHEPNFTSKIDLGIGRSPTKSVDVTAPTSERQRKSNFSDISVTHKISDNVSPEPPIPTIPTNFTIVDESSSDGNANLGIVETNASETEERISGLVQSGENENESNSVVENCETNLSGRSAPSSISCFETNIENYQENVCQSKSILQSKCVMKESANFKIEKTDNESGDSSVSCKTVDKFNGKEILKKVDSERDVIQFESEKFSEDKRTLSMRKNLKEGDNTGPVSSSIKEFDKMSQSSNSNTCPPNLMDEDDISLASYSLSSSQSGSKPSIHWDTHPGADDVSNVNHTENIATLITIGDNVCVKSSSTLQEVPADINSEKRTHDNHSQSFIDSCLTQDYADAELFYDVISERNSKDSNENKEVLTEDLLGINSEESFGKENKAADIINLLDDDNSDKDPRPIDLIDSDNQSDAIFNKDFCSEIHESSSSNICILSKNTYDTELNHGKEHTSNANATSLSLKPFGSVATNHSINESSTKDCDDLDIFFTEPISQQQEEVSLPVKHGKHEEAEMEVTGQLTEALECNDPVCFNEVGQTLTVSEGASDNVSTNSDLQKREEKYTAENEKIPGCSVGNGYPIVSQSHYSNCEISDCEISDCEILDATFVNVHGNLTESNLLSVNNHTPDLLGENDTPGIVNTSEWCEEASNIHSFLKDCLNSQVLSDGRSERECIKQSDEVESEEFFDALKESNNDSLMVTAREYETHQSLSPISESHHEKDNTLSEVSSSVFESFKDAYPPLDPDLTKKLSALEHTPDFFSESSDSLDLPKQRATHCDDGDDNDDDETLEADSSKEDINLCSVSSEQANVVLGEFRQMLEEVASVGSSADLCEEETPAIDCALPNTGEIIEQLDSDSVCFESCRTNPTDRENTVSSENYPSLLEEIQGCRPPSLNPSEVTNGKQPKADAWYEAVTSRGDPSPSNKLVKSRKQFWDSVIADNKDKKTRKYSSSSESTSQIHDPTTGSDDDSYYDVDLESDSTGDVDVCDNDPGTVGLIAKMKKTWEKWFTGDDEEGAENKKETEEELDGFQNVNVKELVVENQNSASKVSGSPTVVRPERVLKSKVRSKKNKDKSLKPELKSPDSLKTLHSDTKPPGVDEKNCALLADNQSSCHQSDSGLSISQGDFSQGDTENLPGIAEDRIVSPNYSSDILQHGKGLDTAQVSIVGKQLTDKSEVLQENCERVATPCIETLEGQSSYYSPNSAEKEQNNICLQEESSPSIQKEKDQHTTVDTTEVMNRYPSIKNIKKGIVQNRKFQWEEGLSALEEKDLPANDLEEDIPLPIDVKEHSHIKGYTKVSPRGKSPPLCQLSVRIKSGIVLDSKMKWEQQEFDALHDNELEHNDRVILPPKENDEESEPEGTLERNPSIKNIEKGYVHTKKIQWESGLPITIEEDLNGSTGNNINIRKHADMKNETKTSTTTLQSDADAVISKQSQIENPIYGEEAVVEEIVRSIVTPTEPEILSGLVEDKKRMWQELAVPVDDISKEKGNDIEDNVRKESNNSSHKLSEEIRSGSVLDAKLLFENKQVRCDQGANSDFIDKHNGQISAKKETLPDSNNSTDRKKNKSSKSLRNSDSNVENQSTRDQKDKRDGIDELCKPEIIRSRDPVAEPEVMEGHVISKMEEWQNLTKQPGNQYTDNTGGKMKGETKSVPGYNLSVKIKSGTVLDAKLMWEDKDVNFIADDSCLFAKDKTDLQEVVVKSKINEINRKDMLSPSIPSLDIGNLNQQQIKTISLPGSNPASSNTEIIKSTDHQKEVDISEGLVENKKKLWQNMSQKTEFPRMCDGIASAACVPVQTQVKSFLEYSKDDDLQTSTKEMKTQFVKSENISQVKNVESSIFSDKTNTTPSTSAESNVEQEKIEQQTPDYNLSIRIRSGTVEAAKKKWESNEFETSYQHTADHVSVNYGIPKTSQACSDMSEVDMENPSNDASPIHLAEKGLVKEGLKKWNKKEYNESVDSFNGQIESNSNTVAQGDIYNDSELEEISETESALNAEHGILHTTKKYWEAKESILDNELSSDHITLSGLRKHLQDGGSTSGQTMANDREQYVLKNKRLLELQGVSMEVNCDSETNSLTGETSNDFLIMNTTKSGNVLETDREVESQLTTENLIIFSTSSEHCEENKLSPRTVSALGDLSVDIKAPGVDVLEWKLQKKMVLSEHKLELSKCKIKSNKGSLEILENVESSPEQLEGDINNDIKFGSVSMLCNTWEGKERQLSTFESEVPQSVDFKRLGLHDELIDDNEVSEQTIKTDATLTGEGFTNSQIRKEVHVVTNNEEPNILSKCDNNLTINETPSGDITQDERLSSSECIQVNEKASSSVDNKKMDAYKRAFCDGMLSDDELNTVDENHIIPSEELSEAAHDSQDNNDKEKTPSDVFYDCAESAPELHIDSAGDVNENISAEVEKHHSKSENELNQTLLTETSNDTTEKRKGLVAQKKEYWNKKLAEEGPSGSIDLTGPHTSMQSGKKSIKSLCAEEISDDSALTHNHSVQPKGDSLDALENVETENQKDESLIQPLVSGLVSQAKEFWDEKCALNKCNVDTANGNVNIINDKLSPGQYKITDVKKVDGGPKETDNVCSKSDLANLDGKEDVIVMDKIPQQNSDEECSPSAEEIETKSLVAQKKGFWDEFIAKREQCANERMNPVSDKYGAHRRSCFNEREMTGMRKCEIIDDNPPSHIISEINESKTSLGRKLSITIKKGSVRASQEIYERSVEDSFSNWKNVQPTGVQGSRHPKKSRSSDSVNRHRSVRTKKLKQSKEKVDSPSTAEEDSSTDEQSPRRPKRKTSIKIQKGLVQQYKSHWEKRGHKTGYWTWKRHRMDSSRSRPTSPVHLRTSVSKRNICSDMQGRHSPQNLQVPGKPYSHGEKHFLPVSVGKQFWEHERLRTPTPPLITPERPLTPEEADEFLIGFRGKVASERRRFDSLGSVISTGSASSLDTLEDKLTYDPGDQDLPEKVSLDQDYIESVVGKVSRQKGEWEKMCHTNKRDKKSSEISAKYVSAEKKVTKSTGVSKVVSPSNFDNENADVSGVSSSGKQCLVYILHSTIEGDLVLETMNDQYKNRTSSSEDGTSQVELSYSDIKSIKGRKALFDNQAEAPVPVRRKKRSFNQGIKATGMSEIHSQTKPAAVNTMISKTSNENSQNITSLKYGLEAKPDSELYTNINNFALSQEKDDSTSDIDQESFENYRENFKSARCFFENRAQESHTICTQIAENICVPSIYHDYIGKENHLSETKEELRLRVSDDSLPEYSPSLSPADEISKSPSIIISDNVYESEHEVRNESEHEDEDRDESEYEVRNESEHEDRDESECKVSDESENKEVVVLENFHSHLVDHSCQTDDELEEIFSSQKSRKHMDRKSDITYTNQPKEISNNSPCDQEVQVCVYDLINPLKRHAPQESRHYDLLDMPKLKRRIYIRRRKIPCQLPRSNSLPSFTTSETANETTNESPQDPLELVDFSNTNNKMIKESWVSKVNQKDFGIGNTFPLVASLMDLARDLPSAYPGGQQENQSIDDLADLDPEVFQHFPKGEVIKTLTGCYRGEFPHIPVTGHPEGAEAHAGALKCGRPDLISLRDLRRSSLPGALALLPTSEEPAQESPVHVIHHPFQPMDAITAHLMKSDISIEDNDVQYSSSESVDISSLSEPPKLRKSSDAETPRTTPSDSLLTNQGVSSDAEIVPSSKDCTYSSEEEKSDKILRKYVPSICHAFGRGLHHGKVGCTNTFVIDTSGAEQGEVTIKVEGPFEGSVLGTEVYPLEEAPGAYQVQFQVAVPGEYIITIMWSGEHLLGSPFSCAIEP